jgi:hypothetical protein
MAWRLENDIGSERFELRDPERVLCAPGECSISDRD